jgi:TetR/AcrR family transcriptional regulator, regulator of autoinduction and epiphytic fitness
VDGRVQRGARNREAIADALLTCYEDGILRPSLPEVAARAGVSLRSVHNHFDDAEALRADVARRQWERFASYTKPVASIAELVDARAALYEGVTPVRRAALLSVHESPTIARNLARFDRILRTQLAALFADLAPDRLDAIELLTSWDAWNRLRTAQGCSVAGARRILTDSIRTLTEGSAP